MERSRVTTLVGLGIRVELRALPMEKKHVVPRQPPCPQVPFVVECVLFVVESSFCLQKETNVQINIHDIRFHEYNLYQLDS